MFDYVFARRDELSKALELVSGHSAVTTALKSQVLLKVSVEVLFKGQVADEAHATDAAVELNTAKDLHLGRFMES